MRHRRTGTAAALVLAAAAMVTVLATPARGTPVTVDFDDLDGLNGPGEGPARPVTDQYAQQGVRFNGPAALDYTQGSPPMPGFPHSGPAAIQPCYGQDLCTTPVAMTFAAPQQRVRVWVGYHGVLDGPADVRLVAFDDDGGVVGRTDTRLGPSEEPVSIDTPLEIAAPAADITTAEVDVAGFETDLAVDTIVFEQLAPELALSEGEIDFGTVETGDRAERPVSATNVGTAPLTIENVTLDDDTSAFTLSADECSGAILRPQTTCALTVDFGPAEDSEVSAVLTVASDDPDGPHTVTLIGARPVDSALQLSPDSIDFDTVDSDAHVERDLTAMNVGTAPLAIDSISVEDSGASGFSVEEGDCTQRPLEPGASCTLTIAFGPTDEDGRVGTALLVASDAPGSPHTVALAATVDGGDPPWPPNGVEVPDLFGMTLAEAEDAVRDDLVLRPDGDAADEATVDTQDPAAGETVEAGSVVSVTLIAPQPNGNLVAGLLGALAVAVVVLVFLSPKSTRWVRKHVRYRPRSDVRPDVTADDLGGEPSLTVRIVARPDAGIHDLDEVTR